VASPGDLPWVCRGEAGPLWIAPKVHHACNACIEVLKYSPEQKTKALELHEKLGPAELHVRPESASSAATRALRW
jgi:hypothetical protein